MSRAWNVHCWATESRAARTARPSPRRSSLSQQSHCAPDGRAFGTVSEFEGLLGPSVVQFVERHITSLLAWDVVVFFARNPDKVLDATDLASRLGRKLQEVEPETELLCRAGVLYCTDGLFRYEPTDGLREQIGGFVDACQDRGRRLALIALVLRNIDLTTVD